MLLDHRGAYTDGQWWGDIALPEEKAKTSWFSFEHTAQHMACWVKSNIRGTEYTYMWATAYYWPHKCGLGFTVERGLQGDRTWQDGGRTVNWRTKFAKRKYNRGREHKLGWVIGGCERDNKKNCFAGTVPDHTADILIPIILEAHRHTSPTITSPSIAPTSPTAPATESPYQFWCIQFFKSIKFGTKNPFWCEEIFQKYIFYKVLNLIKVSNSLQPSCSTCS